MASQIGCTRVSFMGLALVIVAGLATLASPMRLAAQDRGEPGMEGGRGMRGEMGGRRGRGPTSGPAGAMLTQPLDRNMGAMNRAYRTIKAGAADKTKDEATLAALATMEQATLVAKGQVPPTIEKLSGEEKTKKLTEYRTMMLNLLNAEVELEQHILAGENDKAADSIKSMDELQKNGHAEFRGKED